MAGSFNHITDEKTGKFQGTRLLDHLGDAYEALEEMHAMIYILASGDRAAIERASDRYYARVRGEDDVPEWPGYVDD